MIRINQRSTGAIFLNKKTSPHIFTLVILAGVQALNMNLFLPSLPTMAEYFNVSYSVMQLSISGYFAATAFLPIIIGPISDRMGRRPVMICAILIFILAAICCEFSTSFGYFLFFRIIQATIAAGMVLGRAIVRDMVSMNQAASMIGYITMAMTIMPMLGPAIGGLIEENFEQFSHSKSLHVFIDQILKRSKIVPKDLSAISISEGPGSYTGLRIGISAAKGLCFGLGIPLISSDTLFILSRKIECSEGYIISALDARRNEIYYSILKTNKCKLPKKIIEPDSLELSKDSFEKYLNKDIVNYAGNSNEKIKGIIDHKNDKVRKFMLPSAN